MNSNKFIYQQLASNIKDKISSGEYRIGEKIMSERKMSEIYKINRLTVRKAIQLLVDEGYIEKIQGKGNIVVGIPLNKNITFGEENNTSLSRTLIQKNVKNTRRVISLREVSEPSEILSLFYKSDAMYELVRLTEIDDRPYALQVCYFPKNYYKNPEKFDFENKSLYEYMALYDKVPTIYETEMEIDKPGENIKNILNLENEELIFDVLYKSYAKNNEILEYTKAYYIAENTIFKHSSKKIEN